MQLIHILFTFRHNKKKYVEIQDAKRKGEGPYGHVKYPKKMKKS